MTRRERERIAGLILSVASMTLIMSIGSTTYRLVAAVIIGVVGFWLFFMGKQEAP